jgi:UDP-glucose 4-epimerase
MQQVLVTGGAGFIGSHLAARLLRDGYSVRILDNFSTGHRRNLEFEAPSDRLEVLTGDLREPEVVQRAMTGVELVFHEAALASVQRSIADPALTDQVNVAGTLNLLVAAHAARVRRVIFAGSSSVYGNAADLPKREDQRPVPISPYGVSKLAGEEYLRVFHHVHGLETVTLRYFNVFGPRQTADSEYSAVIPIFLSHIFRGERPLIYGDGEQSRDFTYVDDVVEANLLAARAPLAAGQTINVACGRRHSVLALCRRLIEFAGAQIEPRHVDPRPGDVRHSEADITRARTLLGYAPRVAFEDGLRRTFEWFQSVAEEAGAARRR